MINNNPINIKNAIFLYYFSHCIFDLVQSIREEKAIQSPLSRYKSKNGLTVDEVDAKLRSLKSEIEILKKEFEVAVSIYRESNIHARRDEMDGAHPALQVSELEINLERFQDVYSSIKNNL